MAEQSWEHSNHITRHCLRHVVKRSSQGNKVSGYTKMSKHLVKGLKYETVQSISERIFFLTSMKPGNNEIISKTLFANFLNLYKCHQRETGS